MRLELTRIGLLVECFFSAFVSVHVVVTVVYLISLLPPPFPRGCLLVCLYPISL